MSATLGSGEAPTRGNMETELPLTSLGKTAGTNPEQKPLAGDKIQ